MEMPLSVRHSVAFICTADLTEGDAKSLPERKDFMTDEEKINEQLLASVSGRAARSHEFVPVELPRPELDDRTSVMKALRKRKTTREISERKLSLRIISNLLWAACGVNRKKGPFEIPGRTAASASNSQEIHVYVLTKDGVYLYDPFRHLLDPVLQADLRPIAINPGQASLAVKAPFHLIYVADIDRLVNTAGYPEPGLHDPEVQKSYYFVDTGMIAANVYLFAASHGLAGRWFQRCGVCPGELMAGVP